MLGNYLHRWNKQPPARPKNRGIGVGGFAVWAVLLWSLSASPSHAASDFQWTITTTDSYTWTLTSVSSPQVFAGSLPALNPTINLILGRRYGVSNLVAGSHPFEVLAKGTDPFSDVVLLSESAAGSLESDPEIAWSDTGSGAVEFTVTAGLISAMRSGGLIPGYRCSVHTDSMRGDFQIVESRASDFQWTMTSTDSITWTLTDVSSPQVFAGPLATPNPTINLILGKRYTVTNPVHGLHYFEVLAKGSSSASDVVLLSESAAGSLESDPDIAWSDSGGGVVEFTVTSNLIAAMRSGGMVPGYRCSLHPDSMRGDFLIFGDGVRITDPITTLTFGSIRVRLETVAEGLTAPLGVMDPDDGTGRLFIYEQSGKIWTLLNGALLTTPTLDVSSRLVPLGIVQGVNIGYDERGLLGLALHPSFATNGKLYTYTSEPSSGAADFTVSIPPTRQFDHQSVVAEWRMSTTTLNVANPSTRREILRIDEPQFNHNGGEMRFGPDGKLYISLGDGGGADDQDGADSFGQPLIGHGPNGNGQNIETILGSLIRIDVDGDRNSANGRYGIPADNPFVGAAGVDEIFAYGFRNPFRFSFDMETGDLYVGDVGQNDIEEIDLVTKGSNYGWRLKEGTFYFNPNGLDDGFVMTAPAEPLPAGLVDPIAQYDHGDGLAVLGGFIYHGSAVPELMDRYVFGDFGTFTSPSGKLFYLDAAGKPVRFRIAGPGNAPGLWLKGLGQDRQGEIYVCGSKQLGPSGNTGVVLKIAPAPTSTTEWRSYR